MPHRQPSDWFAPYDPDKCRVCGECLAACPVMKVEAGKAREAIDAMRRGEHVAWIERRCQMCLACNLACEQGANPAQLIHARFADTMAQRGPYKWSLYFQQQQKQNFRAAAAAALSAEDQALLSSWSNESPAEEITYPGCNVCNTPWLTRTKMLAGQTIRGGFHLCCGEPFYRTGMEDELGQCARRLNRWLERLGVRRLNVLCTAGTCMFRYVLPRYGLTRQMEVRPCLERIYGDFKAGRYEIVRPLDLRVAVQESCYGKVLGPAYMDMVRELLAMIGCQVVEMSHHRENSLCCGIGAGFPPAAGYHPARLMAGAIRVWREAAAAGADRLVSYCSGCLLTLSSMGYFYPWNIGISHLLSLLSQAIGEEMPEEPIKPVRRALVAGAVRRQFPRLIDFRRTKLEPFEE